MWKDAQKRNEVNKWKNLMFMAFGKQNLLVILKREKFSLI